VLLAALFAHPAAAVVPAGDRSAAALERERLAALVSQGQVEEAAAGFGALLEADPADVDAAVWLARLRRWSRRLEAARALSEQALAIDPSRGDAREELAWALAESGHGRRAVEVLAEATPSPGLAALLARLQRPALTLSGALSDDTNGLSRAAPRIALAWPLPADASLTVGAGWSRLGDAAGPSDHRLVGATVRAPTGPLWLSGGYTFHQGSDSSGSAAFHEASVGVRLQPGDGLALDLSARRRPMVEAARSLATDDEAFHQAGVGGALDLAKAQWLSVSEARLALQASPAAPLFTYAEGRVLATGDDNRGWSMAAGVGLDLLRLFSLRAPASLQLRWDAYLTGFAQRRAAYYSPSFQDGHSPGLDLRVRFGDSAEVGVEGGPTFSLFSDGQVGWFAGGQARLRAGGLSAALHLQERHDPWYGSRRAWLSLGAGL
jgi:hypothetical protein